MAKRTRITIETDSLLILRGRKSLRAWCPQCDAAAEMIPLKDAGAVSTLSAAEVKAWLESAGLHRITTAQGVVMICLNSLLAQLHRTSGGEQPFG